MSQFIFTDPKKLWNKFVFAILAIFICISLEHFASTLSVGDKRYYTSALKAVSEQKTLIHKTVHRVDDYAASDYQDQTILSDTQSLVNKIKNTQDQIIPPIEAAAEIEIPKAVLALYYPEGLPEEGSAHTSTGLAADIQQIINVETALLSGDSATRTATVNSLHTVARRLVLNDLNQVRSLFEQTISETDARIRNVENIGYFAAILLLFVEMIFIFRPAHKTIVAAFDELETVNDDLTKREIDTFAALEEAEEAWQEADHARRNAEEQAMMQVEFRQQLYQELLIPLQSLDSALSALENDNKGKNQHSTKALRAAQVGLKHTLSSSMEEPYDQDAYDVKSLIETVELIVGGVFDDKRHRFSTNIAPQQHAQHYPHDARPLMRVLLYLSALVAREIPEGDISLRVEGTPNDDVWDLSIIMSHPIDNQSPAFESHSIELQVIRRLCEQAGAEFTTEQSENGEVIHAIRISQLATNHNVLAATPAMIPPKRRFARKTADG